MKPNAWPWAFPERNNRRHLDSTPAQVAAARRALLHVKTPEQREAALLRILCPEATLAELAATCEPPLTKDQYAGRLRRAIACAL